MKPAPFRLASVLQLYVAREDAARSALGEAVRAREFAAGTLAAAHAELEANTDSYNDLRSAGFAAASHQRHWYTMQEGQKRCRFLQGKLAEAYQAEAQARQGLVEARRPHEMVLKLRERHTEEQRLESLRHDEHELGDFFNANLIRRARLAALQAGA